MSGIKKLAGQTIWYGVSTIVARFINYLLLPYLTIKLATSVYGEFSLVYSFIPFMNVVFTYGMETAYFRFSNANDRDSVFNTTSISLICSTLLLTVVLVLLRAPIATALSVGAHPEYILVAAGIIAIDALCGIPFARLRQEGRPVKFALTKVGGILVNIAATYLLLSTIPQYIALHPEHWMAAYYDPNWAVGYLLVANLIQNAVVLLLLSKEFFG
ncbi:MAG: oligosaccharide flippase family protein, partial [Sediminibacterium sp.]